MATPITTTYTNTTTGMTYTVFQNTLGPPLNLLSGVSTITVKTSDGTTVGTFSGVPNGTIAGNNLAGVNNIVTGSGNVGSAVNVLGNTYASMPGSTGSINILATVASATTFVIGGTTTINVALGVANGNTIDVYGGTASLAGGQVAGLLQGSNINIGYGGTFNYGTNLISALTASNVNFTTGGGTFILNAGGNVIDLSAKSMSNYDPSKDVIEIQNSSKPIATYTIGDGPGGAKVVTLLDANGQNIATYSATLATGVTLNNGTYTPGTGNNPLAITYLNGNTFVGLCFLPGTMIRTCKGDVAIEDIRIGDQLVAFVDGTDVLRDVIWTGSRQVAVNPNLPNDMSGYPVRVLAGAIADNVPHKDLLVTSEHCLFLDGKMVPARMMVNDRTIFYDRSITSYTYYHVETAKHSVIYSDGMLSESYLDTGNRVTFYDDATVVGFPKPPLSWEKDAAAPLETDPANLEPIYRGIEARAIAAGHSRRASEPELLADPDLRVITDKGIVVAGQPGENGTFDFALPEGVQAVRIVSRASRPCDTIGAYHDDRRQLGVLVGSAVLHADGDMQPVDAHLTSSDLRGWHAFESARCRWTNGDAILPIGAAIQGGVLTLRILSAGPYLADPSIRRAA